MPYVANQHYEKNVLVSADDDGPFVNIEIDISNISDDFKCGRKVACAEENPSKDHEMESHNNLNRFNKSIFRKRQTFLKQSLDNKRQPVKHAPDHKFPRCTMPESAQQHRKEQIDVGPDFPFSV